MFKSTSLLSIYGSRWTSISSFMQAKFLREFSNVSLKIPEGIKYNYEDTISARDREDIGSSFFREIIFFKGYDNSCWYRGIIQSYWFNVFEFEEIVILTNTYPRISIGVTWMKLRFLFRFYFRCKNRTTSMLITVKLFLYLGQILIDTIDVAKREHISPPLLPTCFDSSGIVPQTF